MGIGIPTRSPDRDLATDQDRIERLRSLLVQLRHEVEHERNGLQTRYDQARNIAAFALEALENGGSAELSEEADALGTKMKRYHDRMAALHSQAAFLSGVEQDVGAYRATLASS
jgi:hypothetical protein